MKSRFSNKKDYIVIKFDDYYNEWRAFSIPVTFNQAVKLIVSSKAFNLDVVRLKDWENKQLQAA